MYVVGPKSFRPDHLFKVTEIKQLYYFSTQSPFISTHFSTDTLTSPQMALYIPHSIFHWARLLYVRPETFGPYYVLVFESAGVGLRRVSRHIDRRTEYSPVHTHEQKRKYVVCRIKNINYALLQNMMKFPEPV